MSQPLLAFTFPAGRRRTLTIAATAGNVATNLSPDAGKRWIVLAGRLVLVCDANAANRYIVLQQTDGTNVIAIMDSGALAIATQTTSLSFGAMLYGRGTVASDSAYIGVGNLMIVDADQLRITIAAGLAGDSYSGFIEVLEISV